MTIGSPFRALLIVLVNLLIGLLVGVLFDYFLYRISLPVEPFVYLVF